MRRAFEEQEEDASRRVNHALSVIIKLAEKMENRWKENSAPRSYAQVTYIGRASAT